MARSIHQPLVWIDCEMTGLDTRVDRIIEIATLITDSDLNIVAEGPEIAIHRPKALLDGMNDWNTKHHTQSGLVERVLQSNIEIEEADRLTHEFIAQYCEKRSAPLCGNSVWQDRRFIDMEMPLTSQFLHYRNVDVSSFKEMARRWYPKLEPYKKANHHRALDDIRESIEELKYYRQMLFKTEL
ncbi:MAG: oligoribonuclease [Proteobacteria bacterium]|jgi:oligoribonuclease|nr:oligoribonuclease [Pseudomonadota bacterium]